MRYVAMAAAAGMALIGWAGVRADDSNARTIQIAMGLAQRGLASLEKGNTARAREDFEKSIVKYPGLPEAHIGLGHLAMRERRFEDALEEYRRAQQCHRELSGLILELSTDRYAKSREELTRLRIITGQLDMAAARSEGGGGDSGTMTGSGKSEGQIQRERTEVDRQIAELETMDAPNPTTAKEPPARLYFFEGNALFDLQRVDDAITAWEEAARRDPKFAPVQNNLAVAYWRKGRLADAQAALDRAVGLGFQVNPSFRDDLARSASSLADGR
jgi:tetratricopeptide (TPR) repeat protein